MTTTLPLGSLYTAHLDPFTGNGLLVCPTPESNVYLGAHSVHEASWNEALQALARHGWTLATDHDGTPLEEGVTVAGEPVLGLYHPDPISSATAPDGEAWHHLGLAAGLQAL